MKQIIGCVLVFVMCIMSALIALIWMSASLVIGNIDRSKTVAIGFDQLCNATFGGDEDETISARCWRLRDSGIYRLLQPLIDRAFYIFAGQLNHCEKSYRQELKKNG